MFDKLLKPAACSGSTAIRDFQRSLPRALLAAAPLRRHRHRLQTAASASASSVAWAAIADIFDEATLARAAGAPRRIRHSTPASRLSERATDPHRLRAWPDRRLPQRQHRQRQRDSRPAGARRIDLPDNDTGWCCTSASAGRLDQGPVVESVTQLSAFSPALIARDHPVPCATRTVPPGAQPPRRRRVVCSETCARPHRHDRPRVSPAVLAIGAGACARVKPFRPCPWRTASSSVCFAVRTARCSAKRQPGADRARTPPRRETGCQPTWWCRCPTRASVPPRLPGGRMPLTSA